MSGMAAASCVVMNVLVLTADAIPDACAPVAAAEDVDVDDADDADDDDDDDDEEGYEEGYDDHGRSWR